MTSHDNAAILALYKKLLRLQFQLLGNPPKEPHDWDDIAKHALALADELHEFRRLAVRNAKTRQPP